MGMFTLRLLLYADTHDQCQARVKQRAWSQLIELVADLQVPLIVDFDRDGALAIIAKSYPTIAIVDKFMTTMREESKEKRLLTYYATSYADVLRLYGECDDNNDERMERKVANVYNEIGKKTYWLVNPQVNLPVVELLESAEKQGVMIIKGIR